MEREELESLLSIASESPNQDVQEEAKAELWRNLACPVCAWDGNKNRLMPDDLRWLFAYAQGFAIADLKHRMHHAYPGRFLVSRRLTPKCVRQEIEMERAFNKELDRRIGLWEEASN